LQLPEHAVVLGVGDFRIVEDVVTIGVVVQLLAELGDFSLGLRGVMGVVEMCDLLFFYAI
jgi:hypothetical protein